MQILSYSPMRASVLRVLIVLAALIALAAIPIFASAQPPPGFELRFSEDFESDPLEGWSLAPSCAIVPFEGSQVLLCTPELESPEPIPGLAILEDYVLGEENFFLRYRFRSVSGVPLTNLMLSIDGDEVEGYFILHLFTTGDDEIIRLFFEGPGLETRLLRRAIGSEGDYVAESGPLAFDPGAWYTSEVTYVDGTLVQAIFLNGEFIGGLEYEDPDPLSSGQLGFLSFSGEAYFDDIEIWEPAAELPPELEPYTFSGQVFEGEPGGLSAPLEGATIAIFGANNPHPAEGDLLGKAGTTLDGSYEMEVPPGFEFYAVRLFPPEGYELLAARSPGGTVQDPDWIEYVLPFESPEFAGDAFYLRSLDREPEPEFIEFSGRVFVGEPGDRSNPLRGATVELSGARDPFPAGGEYLNGFETGPGGDFRMEGPSGFEFYSLRLHPPDNYIPIDALSPGGDVQTPDWIEFPPPIEQRQTNGNEFFVLPTRIPDEIPTWDYPNCLSGDLRLLANSFDTDDTGDWYLDGWRVENGFLVSDAEAYASFSADDWLETSVRLGLMMAEGGDLLINLHDDEEQRYKFFIKPEEVGLEKVDGSEDIYSDSQGVPLKPGQWVEVEIAARDGSSWIALDGQIILRALDQEPLGGGDLYLENLGGGRVMVDVLWVCGQFLEPPPPPPVSPWFWLIVGAIVVGVPLLLIGGLGLIGWRLFFRGPGDPSKPGPLLPPTPGLPPVRLANAWLSEGGHGRGKPLRLDNSLAASGSYTLHVQIQPRQQSPRSGAVQTSNYPLKVVFFSPDGDFTMPDTHTVEINLPEEGASQEARLNLQPKGTGPRRVRVGIYHRNTLLQSLVMDMQVTERRRRTDSAIQRNLDYVASSRFIDLDTLGSPQLNIFTNQTSTGDRWIGLFSDSDESPDWLQQGAVHKFSSNFLAARAVDARTALSKAAGERIYRLDYSLPMDPDTLKVRSADLIALAKSGYKLYDAIFYSILGAQKKDYLRNLSDLLAEPGSIISIARCRDDGTSFPWSALYSYYLDGSQEIELCPVFERWLSGQGESPQDGSEPYFLENPETCHSRDDCPLSSEASDRKVCPFGFWGFMHQIEQPLQLVDPVPVNAVPEEINDPEYESTSRILRIPGERLRMGMGVFAGFTGLNKHEDNLRSLAAPSVLELTSTSDPEQVHNMLTVGGRHLLYFFCHGRTVDGRFVLEVGDSAQAQQISASDLNWMRIDWPTQPQTLVFINACKSLAIYPGLVHGFLGKLRNLGASGVIGVEISNWSQFAAPFAERLLEQVLDGSTLGEAILRARRSFLREGNPLGLVYSLHGPAHLHFHSQAGCPHCAEG